jgi:hypothetical protein
VVYSFARHMAVNRESRIVDGNRHTFACAGDSTSPAYPHRHEKGRTRREALESTMGRDHRECAAARDAFFYQPQLGLPSGNWNPFSRAEFFDGEISENSRFGSIYDAM